MAVRRGGPPRALTAPGAGRDRGMVTAELAVALPALVLAALLALSGLQVVMAQLRCRDAAAIAARLAGRGEPRQAVTDSVVASGPPGARVAWHRDGDLVAAQVTTDVHLLGVGRLLPAFSVTATAFAVSELEASP